MASESDLTDRCRRILAAERFARKRAVTASELRPMLRHDMVHRRRCVRSDRVHRVRMRMAMCMAMGVRWRLCTRDFVLRIIGVADINSSGGSGKAIFVKCLDSQTCTALIFVNYEACTLRTTLKNSKTFSTVVNLKQFWNSI